MSDTGINLTAVARREGITNIRFYEAFDRVSVTLRTGQVGNAPTLAEAIAKAKQDMTFARREAA